MGLPSTVEVSIELLVDRIDCPGMRLPDKDMTYLRIYLFDVDVRTAQVPPYFPIVFQEQFQFCKVSVDSHGTTDVNLGQANCLASRISPLDLWREITKTRTLEDIISRDSSELQHSYLKFLLHLKPKS
jgi:hypothetical protein